jgi:phosphatidylinositol alpha-1,6-mannosyltransferase
VAEFSDQVTILTKKIPGWMEFDRRESTSSLHIIRHGRPMPNWKYYQLPRIVFPLVQSVRLLKAQAPDLIHFGDLCPPGVISLCLKFLLGYPYLAYCHGDENAQIDQRRFQPVVRDQIYQQAAAVVAANEFARQGLIRIGVPEARIHKITPGVDLERFHPAIPNQELAKQLCLTGKTVLLTVARLVPKKGHRAVLKAVARINRDFPDLKYLIVGEGPERHGLESLTKELGLSQVVNFLGNVPNERLPEFYNLCDVFVMANGRTLEGDIETFGMVFVEANAVGKPVVAGRCGGATEAVIDGSTGLLVDPEDIDQLEAALKLVLSNKELREKLGSAGLRRAQVDFDWKSRAKALHQVSQDILKIRRTQAEQD